MFSKKELVVYENQFNTGVALRGFTKNQLSILMAISTKMRNEEGNIVKFNFNDIRNIIDYKNGTNEELAKEIVSVNQKLLGLNFKFKIDSRIIQFALFTVFETDIEKCTLEVTVNERFRFLLNGLTSEFTEFELLEFIKLKSTYSQEFFRRMKQFRNTGVWKVSIDDFKYYLSIPSSYTLSHIDTRVLKPIISELKEKYDLKVKKIYNKKNKGRPSVSSFKFTFKKEIAKPKRILTEYSLESLLSLYSMRTLSLHDKNTNRHNFCRIINIEKIDNKYVITLQNVDDNFISKINYFETQEHLQRFINKYLV